jgi:hypothetical protein
MPIFRITTDSGSSVDLNLVFNTNPLGTNTWTMVSGDPTILSFNNGIWFANGLTNILVVQNPSGIQLAEFDSIPIAISLTDPFQDLTPDQSGAGLLNDATTTPIEWIFNPSTP